MAHRSRPTGVAIAVNLVPFAGIAFLWFIGVIRDRIGQHEDRFFATVLLGSGLIFVAMLFVSAPWPRHCTRGDGAGVAASHPPRCRSTRASRRSC